MKRPASTRRECVQDYQRPIRRKQFSPSPSRKSQSSRTSSHAKLSKFQSANPLNAATLQPCITNNKENFGVEPTIKHHADRQKKTALGCLREHPLPPELAKHRSFDALGQSAANIQASLFDEHKPLGETQNISKPGTECEPDLKQGDI